jgi:putative addiction module component (TIGR02574 family)
MSAKSDSVRDEALKLPEQERARLASDLLASLDGEAEDGVEAAWAAEVEKRKGEVQRGEAGLVPWEQVKAEVKAALKQR